MLTSASPFSTFSTIRRVAYGDRVVRSSVQPIILRGGVHIEDPLNVVLSLLEKWRIDASEPVRPTSFDESDLRLANGDGARISSVEIAAILDRRPAIERALRSIAPDASLAVAAESLSWFPLGRLFDAFADIRGVGCSKMTKALHRKRPALIPMLDSTVQKYLEDDDLGRKSPFGERSLALVRGYKRDLDSNRAPLRSLRQELVRRNHRLSEVRILDLLIVSRDAAA